MLLAIIPARSGSKGLKDKNIKPLNNKPLLAYSIQAALKSGIFDEVMVSSDSPSYLEIARSFGAKTPFLRAEKNAKDTSSSIEVILEVLQSYKKLGKDFKHIMLLQPTSPLRNERHIKEAFELYVKNDYKALASICPVKKHPNLFRELCNDFLTPIIKIDSSTSLRQNYKDVYEINGAIYINQVEHLHINSNLNLNPLGYLMDKEHSIDIDYLADFMLAKFYLDSKS